MKVHWLEWIKTRYSQKNEDLGFKYNASMPTAIGITLIAAYVITICATPVVTPLLSLAAAVSTVPIINQLTFVAANVFFYGSTALGAAVGWKVIAVPVIHGVEFFYDSVLTPMKKGLELVTNPIKSIVGGVTEYFGSLFASDKEKEKKNLEKERAILVQNKEELEAERASNNKRIEVVDAKLSGIGRAEIAVQTAPDISKPAERVAEQVANAGSSIDSNLDIVAATTDEIPPRIDFTTASQEEINRFFESQGRGK